MKKLIKFLTSRLFLTAFFIFIQLLILFIVLYNLSLYSIYLYGILVMFSLLFVIAIVGDDSNPTFKVAWIIPILVFPFFGWLLYGVFGRRKVTTKAKERYLRIFITSKRLIPQDSAAMDEIKEQDESIFRECCYINKTAHANVFVNTQTEFFPSGEAFFEVYKQELAKAKKFIFLEYFIISEGKMWGEIIEILKQKVIEGVDVRVMYDDLGTINLLKKGYDNYLRSLGMKVCIFNPFKPSLDAFMNYRDHRKITIIDGNVGFTGGLNLADEYINEIERFGYWKDCAIMIKGDAVSKLSIMFLQNWNYSTRTEYANYHDYFCTKSCESDGYVVPFGDGPMSGHLTGEMAYINIINNAKRYIWISTPYLILDNEMITALKIAVQSGVEVKIITPHIPDKWYVHTVTKSNYPILVQAGIKIYEFTPGFIHSKMIIADDVVGIVGTTNFDFRSFYLHFENGIFMYKSKAISQVKADFENILSQSSKITPEMCCNVGFWKQFAWSFMKLFSPFL